MQGCTLRFCCQNGVALREAECAGQRATCTEHAKMSGLPTLVIIPTLQVPVNPQEKDNGAAVEKNMIIKLIQSLVSTLQLNERPKSQAGQPAKVNIDSGLPLGPGSSLQVPCCRPAVAQARLAL